MDEIVEVAAPFIRKREDLRLSRYLDSGGVWTIGYGHVWKQGEPTVCNPVMAERWLKEDMSTALNAALSVPGLNAQQHAALTSLVYNIGADAFAKSTLRKRLMETPRDDEKVFTQWRRWHFDNGVAVQGLKNRRELEINLYKGNHHER